MALTVVKKEISLNVGQPNNFELVCAMQGDSKTFEITATLYDVNKLYTINTNNIKIKGINPVGLKIEENISSHTTNTVTFTLTEKMLMYDGLLKLVIIFTDNGQLTTFPFIIKVVDSPGNTTADDVKTLSELVEEARKWAMLSKSYAIGTDNEVRDGDKTDNSKFYYEESKKAADSSREYYDKIQSLVDSGTTGKGTDNSNILYYDTYAEFKADLDTGKIPNETLICIKETKMYFSVQVIKADNMSWDSASGNETQENITDAMIPVTYTANSGYYFPSDYSIAGKNGIDITRNNDTKITISGTPTDDTQITLKAPAKQKTTQNPPTGLSDGGLKINGTTSAMEYASSSTASAWTSCKDGSTEVSAGTWYVRYKETDSLKASDSVSVIIEVNQQDLDTYFKSGTLVALSTTRGVNYSIDHGVTWEYLKDSSFPAMSNAIYDRPKLHSNGNYYVLDIEKNSWAVVRQSKNLKQWTTTYSGDDFSDLFMDSDQTTLFYDNKIMLVGSIYNRSMYSTDNGKTWNKTNLPISSKTRNLTVNSSSYTVPEYAITNFCTNDNSSMYVVGGQHGHCYYSSDGKKWNSISGINENNQYVAAYNNGKFYLIGFLMYRHDEVDDKKIRVYSSNDGISWTKIVEQDCIKCRRTMIGDTGFVWFNNKFVCYVSSNRSAVERANIVIFDPVNNLINYVLTVVNGYEEYMVRLTIHNNELYGTNYSSYVYKAPSNITDITGWQIVGLQTISNRNWGWEDRAVIVSV